MLTVSYSDKQMHYVWSCLLGHEQSLNICASSLNKQEQAPTSIPLKRFNGICCEPTYHKTVVLERERVFRPESERQDRETKSQMCGPT